MKISNQFKIIFVFLLFTVGCYSQTTNTKVKARIVYMKKMMESLKLLIT
jgi:uncharacterized protein YcfL